MVSVSGGPAYRQLAAELREQIRSGALAPGAQLPSMAQLRQQYGVSNTVVRDALNELRRDGLVVGQQGKGVFVDSAAALPEAKDDLMGRLDALAQTVDDLGARVAHLEQAHRSKPARR